MEHLEKAVNDYLEIKETTYALLIDGGWGAGKTFFVKNKLMRKIEVKKYDSLHDIRISKNNESIVYKPIYVSLFGLESISDLEKEIFLAVKPILGNNKNSIIAGTQVGNLVLNAVALFGYRTGTKNVDLQPFIKAWMGIKGEMLLIFDDLERCRINYVELFGFINKFIEQDKIKTIFIADEKQIIRKTDEYGKINNIEGDEVKDIRAQEYKRFKEKVIGKTLDFSPIEEISTLSLIEKYRLQDSYYRFLSSHKKLIANVFRMTKYRNLRSLNQALSDFLFIYQQLTKLGQEDVEYAAEKLLIYTIAFTAEIKSGEFSKEQLLSMKTVKITLERIRLCKGKSLKRNQDQETTFSEIFISKYYDETSISLIGYASITEYLITGYFNEVQFATETKLTETLEKSPEVKLFEKYYEMNQYEFEECYRLTLQRIREGKVSVNTFSQFYSLFEQFIDEHLINETKTELQIIFQEGVINNLIPPDRPDDLRSAFTIEPEHIEDFQQHMTEQIRKIDRKKNAIWWKSQIDEAISTVASNPDKLIELIEGRIQTAEFFEYISAEDFVNAIRNIKENSKLIALRNAIKNRSDIINTSNRKDRSIVYENMGELLQKMIQQEQLQPLRKYNLKIMLNSVREIEQDLKGGE